MPIRVDAPKAWAFANDGRYPAWSDLRVARPLPKRVYGDYRPVRIVWESDWCKLMDVTKAVDAFLAGYTEIAQLACALDALRKKGKKT
jgi:hypothetical protein